MTAAATVRAPARVIWAIGLTQIIGYGTLYYSFSALAPGMAADLGWSTEWVFGVLSAALLLGGLVAPTAGRLADQLGAARLMSWGSVGAAAALALCALAPGGPGFVLGLAAIEMVSSFVLYAAAFTALSQIAPQGAQRSIVLLTLVAGFASTIFWPLTAWLEQLMGWRNVYLVYAALNLTICLPIHLWLTRRARHGGTAGTAMVPLPARVPQADTRLALGLMLAGFALIGFFSSAILFQMLPLLGALQLGASGLLVTTLFGPAQVLSRIVNMRFGRSLSQAALAVFAAAAMPIALAILLITAPWAPGAAAFAVLFGLGSGLISIVSGTLPLSLFGTAHYGRRLGLIGAARQVLSALAPFGFALVGAAASMRLAGWSLVAVGSLATSCFAVLWWRYRQPLPQLGVAALET